MSMLTLWVLFVLFPGLRVAAVIIMIGVVIVSFVTFTFAVDANDTNMLLAAKRAFWRVYTPIFIVCVIVLSLAPSVQDMYVMTGAYVATNAEGAAKLPDNIVQAANAYLEKLAAGAEMEK